MLFAVLTTGCDFRRDLPAVELPTNRVLTIRPHWGVVTDTYARVFTERDRASHIAFHVRAGDVVSLERLESDDSGATWYFVGTDDLRGWLPGNSLVTFDTRSRAESASAGYRVGRDP